MLISVEGSGPHDLHRTGCTESSYFGRSLATQAAPEGLAFTYSEGLSNFALDAWKTNSSELNDNNKRICLPVNSMLCRYFQSNNDF